MSQRSLPLSEPNHGQEIAVQRVDLAIAELATVLLSSGLPTATVTAAIADIRQAVAPVYAGILRPN